MPPCLPSRQGVPSVLLGLVAPAVLTDRPEQARWLSPAERLVLRQALDAGAAGGGGAGGGRRAGGAGSAVEAAPLVATLRATLGLSSALPLTLTPNQVRLSSGTAPRPNPDLNPDPNPNQAETAAERARAERAEAALQV